MNENFLDWLNKSLNSRGWTRADLAKRTGISQSMLSMIFSGDRNISFDVCAEIAKAFSVPPEDVFRIAGLLPPEPGSDSDLEEAIYKLQSLPRPIRAYLYRSIRSEYNQWEHDKTSEPKTQPRKPGTGPLKNSTQA